jgi:MoxR-like ATPase
MNNLNEKELEDFIAQTGDEDLKKMAQAELQKLKLTQQAAGGDELANALLVLKDAVQLFQQQQPAGATGGASVSKDEIEKLVKNALNKVRISYDDLDPELKARLSGSVKIQLTLNLPQASLMASSQTLMSEFNQPLFQKILSDWKARNNVYLFGSAGTGKTFIAGLIADFLGFKKIEINCNQFTSPLDLIGGQTIDGYQKGKLEMAWTNVGPNGEQYKGCVLLLDELPKLDPNTAGLLNSALAKVKEFKGTKGPVILNGKGDELELKNILIIGTGNVRLNETSPEYEANFKQDLSLQDRFAGSCYEVTANYRKEFTEIIKGFAFIWIYMTKLRELIIEERLTGQAFVSVRILISLKDTYIVQRDVEAQRISGEISLTNVKTLKQGVDSFLNLFKPNQIDLLKQKSDYDSFVKLIEVKNKLPLDGLDTPEEINEGMAMVEAFEAKMATKIA